MSSIIKIFGAPGTGKTTELIRRINASGIPLKRVGYMSFSRETLKEVKARMLSQGAAAEDLVNFYTQHSFNYRALGVTRDQIANKKIGEFGKEYNYQFSSTVVRSENFRSIDNPTVFYPDDEKKSDDELWVALELKRKRLLSMDDALRLVSPGMRDGIFQKFERDFYAWLQAHNYIDFTGLVEEGIASGALPDVDLLCIDEAQDNCALQMQQIAAWQHKIPEIILAGDDDQAIHIYAGAEPQLFLDFPCTEKIILSETFRNPQAHLDFAQRLIVQNTNRQPKTITSQKTRGAVIVWDNPSSVPSHIFKAMQTHPELSWFILARNKYTLAQFREQLKSEGVPVGFDDDAADAFAFMTSPPPETIGASALNILLSPLFPSGTYVQRGMKKRLEALAAHPGFKGIPYDALKNHGFTDLFFYDHAHRTLSNLKIKPEDIQYMEKVQKLFPTEIPRVELMTMHASKGKEADCVVLLTDVGKLSHDEEIYGDAESERRVFYVAATRSRYILAIVESPVVRKYRTTVI